jgi:hypothetical protein
MKPSSISQASRMRATLSVLVAVSIGWSAHAQSSFSGVLLATNGSGIVAGTTVLTVDGGHVSFHSTLFQAWVTNTILAPTLEVQGEDIAFDLEKGTQGSWQAGQFTGPLPGESAPPSPNQGFPNLEQMPGLQPLSAGTRFAGVFTAFPALEDALLTSGGKIFLSVKGTVDGMSNPVAAEVLVKTAIRITNQFTATFTSAPAVPPQAGRHQGRGSLTLDGNALIYDLAFDPGFRPARAGLFANASRGSRTAELLGELPDSAAIKPSLNSDELIYRGQFLLNGPRIDQLRHGDLYFEFFSAEHPDGELRGTVLPVEPPVLTAPPHVEFGITPK